MNSKKTIRFYDTSALLAGAPISENAYISSIVLDECEHIKTNALKDDEIKYKARSLVRNLMKNDNWYSKGNYARRRQSICYSRNSCHSGRLFEAG